MAKSEVTLNQVVNALRANSMWQEFRSQIIEKRIEVCRLEILKPINTQEGVWMSERLKGTLLGLQGLLVLFDIELPKSGEETSNDELDAPKPLTE